MNKEEQENNQQTITKKLSLSCQALILFQKGKKFSDVKIVLHIPFKKKKVWYFGHIIKFNKNVWIFWILSGT